MMETRPSIQPIFRRTHLNAAHADTRFEHVNAPSHHDDFESVDGDDDLRKEAAAATAGTNP